MTKNQIKKSTVPNHRSTALRLYGFTASLKRFTALRLFSSTASTKRFTASKGFTFVEIAMVVGILALLSTIVIVNMNIRGNKANANNIKRRTDLESIQGALDLRAQETGDPLPSRFSALTTTYICIGTDTSCYNLTTDLVPLYLGSIPKDPKTGTDQDTGYEIKYNSTTKVVCVKAVDEVNTGWIENCRK